VRSGPLPRNPILCRVESPWVTAVAIAIATIACAAAGYMVGHTKEESAAPSPAANLGSQDDAVVADDSGDPATDAARQRGYEKAFATARDEEFAPAFARSYREAYANVFEAAGLEAPKDIAVPKASGARTASDGDSGSADSQAPSD
jgi:hypothetical protein